MHDGRDSGPQGMQSINWRRFAILGSGVITGVAVIRLAADQIGVPRGTPASAAVAALSNFLMYLALGLAAPSVVSGIRPRPLRQRLMVLVPLGLLCAWINYLIATSDM